MIIGKLGIYWEGWKFWNDWGKSECAENIYHLGPITLMWYKNEQTL